MIPKYCVVSYGCEPQGVTNQLTELPPVSDPTPDAAWPVPANDDTEESTPAEGLVLIKAFVKIKNPQLRQNILELVENIAIAK